MFQHIRKPLLLAALTVGATLPLPLLANEVDVGAVANAQAEVAEAEAALSAPTPTPVARRTAGPAAAPAETHLDVARTKLIHAWDTVTGSPDRNTVAPGTHTESWLTLQRSGAAASANPQAASSVQREKAAERLLKTYDFPIKESFYGDSFKSGE